MSAGQQKGVEDFHDKGGFSSESPGPLIEGARKWQKARKLNLSAASWNLAEKSALHACSGLTTLDRTHLTRSLLDQCARMGFVVRFRPKAHKILGNSVRATIDLQTRIVEVFQPAIEELSSRLAPELRAKALPLVLAHELFHALDPKCGEPELAAHLFAAMVCEYPNFPGLLDLTDSAK